MRRLLATAFSAAVLLAAAPPMPAGAIVGGTTDFNAHQSVGALIGPGGVPRCSGVLVPSRTRGTVFLTAAHCFGWAGNRTWVRVTFGATVRNGPTFNGIYHVMPGYVAATHAHDIAVVVFSRQPRIQPVSLASGSTRLRAGASVTTVGYGTPNIGVRKWATEVVTGYSSSWLFLRTGSGNSCHGDSGGPDLATLSRSAAPVVIAITTQGTCHSNADIPVTSAAVHNFVNNPR